MVKYLLIVILFKKYLLIINQYFIILSKILLFHILYEYVLLNQCSITFQKTTTFNKCYTIFYFFRIYKIDNYKMHI